MKHYSSLLFLCLCFLGYQASFAQKALKVPLLPDAGIQPDGNFDEKVWRQARKVKLAEHTTLYLFQNQDALFIGVKNEDGARRYTDVYFHNEAIGTVNLHASMQLGERGLTANWDDSTPAWNWGNNSQWQANTAKLDETKDKQLPFSDRLQPYQGQEFRIDKAKLKAEQVRLRLEVRDFMGEAEAISYPKESTRADVNSWLYLKM